MSCPIMCQALEYAVSKAERSLPSWSLKFQVRKTADKKVI